MLISQTVGIQVHTAAKNVKMLYSQYEMLKPIKCMAIKAVVE